MRCVCVIFQEFFVNLVYAWNKLQVFVYFDGGVDKCADAEFPEKSLYVLQ